jgi:sucrose phosphorylase
MSPQPPTEKDETMKLIRRSTFNRIKTRLARLYGSWRADELADRLYMLIGRYGTAPKKTGSRPVFSENDAVLITYGDMVQRPGQRPLATLKDFCDRRLAGAINTVHILPFCPSSSDGGFSVIDYREVDPALGKWRDIDWIGRDYRLMVDLVLNHCSSKSRWFRDYLGGIAPEKNYFIEADPGADLSAVVRPRPWPLLKKVETALGTRWVWTTFSADQIDLDWSSPDVLFEFLDILLLYISHGARVVRLDAVGFLWKEPGTSCMHLPQTHEMVKLLHDFLLTAAPEVALITETNVPHPENISYFGDGDEAHMVYQFTLAPMLLYTLLHEDSTYLQCWLRRFAEPPENGTFFNFTASHDGIGLRPLEGMFNNEEIDWLVDETKKRGGLVNTRSMPDGSERPYELNITYIDALSDPDDEDLGLRRFLCSQAVVMCLKGVPAFYFHSLVGTRNWREGAEKGENRDINRRRWQAGELDALLDNPESPHARVLAKLVAMLRTRRGRKAFHPEGGQEILETEGYVLGVLRISPDGEKRVLCWFNFTPDPLPVPEGMTREKLGDGPWRDILADGEAAEPGRDSGKEWTIEPYGTVWLRTQ